MTTLARKTSLLFASTATDIGQFGSAAASAPALSFDPAVIQSLAEWGSGWLSATLGANKFPAVEDMNAVDYVNSYQVTYLLQEGIAEYDAGTNYSQYAICKNPGTFQIYGSLAANNIGHALNDGAHWVLLGNLGNMGRGIVGQARNLFANVTGGTATTVNFTADEVIVESALGGTQFQLANFNQTLNIGTTGAGGMDTGAAPSPGFIAIYAIYNPTTNTQSILATNATSAAAPNVYGGAHMPAGYTASALISVWGVGSGGYLVIGAQKDRNINIVSNEVLNTTSVSTNNSLNLSAAIPFNATTVSGILDAATSYAGGECSISVQSSANGNGLQENLGNSFLSNAGINTNFIGLILQTPQTLYWSSSIYSGTFSGQIYVTSYTI